MRYHLLGSVAYGTRSVLGRGKYLVNMNNKNEEDPG